jgi:hypothetical protein
MPDLCGFADAIFFAFFYDLHIFFVYTRMLVLLFGAQLPRLVRVARNSPLVSLAIATRHS